MGVRNLGAIYLVIAALVLLLSSCGGGPSAAESEAEEALHLLRKEERLSAKGHKLEAESQQRLEIAESCLDTGNYACSETESTRAEVLSSEIGHVAEGLRRIHRQINALSKQAIEVGYKTLFATKASP